MLFARTSEVLSRSRFQLSSMNFRMLPNSYWVLWPDKALARVRRNDKARYAKSKPLSVDLRRRDMIEFATPIVPDDNDRRRLPIRTLANRINNLCYPRWSRVAVISRMVRIESVGNHPRNSRQQPVFNRLEDGGLGIYDVVLPLGAIAYDANRIERVPCASRTMKSFR